MIAGAAKFQRMLFFTQGVGPPDQTGFSGEFFGVNLL